MKGKSILTGVTKELEKLSKSYDNAAEFFQKVDAQGAPPPKFIKALAKNLKCSWGTYWKVDPVAQNLRPVTSWNSPSTNSKKLDVDTKSRSLSLSEGTAGHVWRTRKPVWTNNIIKDMCLPRSLDADEAGLNGGIWFAVKTDDVVYGVVEMLGKELPPASEEALLLIEQMGIELGRIAKNIMPGA